MDANQSGQTPSQIPAPNVRPEVPKEPVAAPAPASPPKAEEQVAPPRPPGYMSDTDGKAPKTEHILQTSAEKTLYNSSWLSLFFRNFTAGFAKALGAILVYAIFLYIGAQVFKNVVYPQLKPFLDSFQSLAETAQTSQSGNLQIDPNMLNQVMEEFGGQ